MHKLGLILTGALILCGAAFYNGYPLLYSDTGTYIASGFDGFVPVDRPITYGLFIRHMSMAVSLWWVIVVQALMMSYILYQAFHSIYGYVNRFVFLASLVFLSLFTALSWYTSEIMPDIFAPAGILCLAILLAGKQKRADHILISLLLLLSAYTHSSHLLIFLLICGLFTILYLLVKRVRAAIPKSRLALAWLLVTLPWLLVPVTHYMYGGGFAINKGSHIYLMGRMLDTGMLKQYLDEKCKENNYTLCAFKDSLPASSRDLMWSGNSPVHKSGGWEATANEYNAIITSTLTEPKYLLRHFTESAKATLRQLLENGMGGGFGPYYEGSPPYEELKRHLPHEINQFDQSRQNANLWDELLNFTELNNWQFWLLSITFIIFIYIYSTGVWRTVSAGKNIFLFLVISGIFFNAAVTASLSVVCNRFQSRVIWLLPLMLIILLQDKQLRSFIKNTLFNNHKHHVTGKHVELPQKVKEEQ